MFCDKVYGATSQKAACIRLYGQYAPEGAEARAWKKECDISPQERQAFQRLWGDNRELCHDCGRATAPGQKHSVRRLGGAFCSTQCATAGTVLSCRECNQPVSAGQPHCATCKWGLPEPAPARRSQQRSRLANVIEENEKNLEHLLKRIRCKQRPDPNHEPAWKRRRRS